MIGLILCIIGYFWVLIKMRPTSLTFLCFILDVLLSPSYVSPFGIVPRFLIVLANVMRVELGGKVNLFVIWRTLQED